MYVDYYLKFANKTEAEKALFTSETSDEETFLRPNYDAVDMIGTIYKPTGIILKTPEGDVPEMKAVSGYHANVRHISEAPELDAFVVAVNSPSRVWAS
ncbi:hypothetical protein UFOVP764_2 [uncultured Caudovirales phage]|jgi:hypothetical protein|uniref:Uncharacterized protein n=1 Tax=uncultured Caudovirales phage TaxID=2100421 RepID=A0A6J5NSA2_9CAUD|nr:hypothetical protein UFOVP764_2 [uncultured Caudovirales phage]